MIMTTCWILWIPSRVSARACVLMARQLDRPEQRSGQHNPRENDDHDALQGGRSVRSVPES